MDLLSQIEVWGGEYWTDGYYVATVEEKNWSVAENHQGKPEDVLCQLEITRGLAMRLFIK